MIDSGYDLSAPDFEELAKGNITTLLPTIIGFKNLPEINIFTPLKTIKSLRNLTNLGKGAHIVWDGLLDDYDESCPYPVDAQGKPVVAGENGRPLHTDEDPMPACHYNKYKFDDNGKRKLPEWGSCIHSNRFEGKGVPYLNFHGTSGLEIIMAIADFDLTQLLDPSNILKGLTNIQSSTNLEGEHGCANEKLKPIPRVVIPPFERSDNVELVHSEEYVKKLCEAEVAEGEINRAALEVNCPLLEQYNLFEDPKDSRSMPHEGGVPFVVNSKLFADYSTKYRVLFVPPGEKAMYKDGQDGKNPNDAIHFPIGTVIAKTFAFTNEASNTERMIETRLLIKRPGQTGKGTWIGLPYIWDEDGVARLAMGGGKFKVDWHYRDADTNELLTGKTDSYSVPNANQCITCHGNDDQVSGSVPIAPKPRNLNRAYKPESNFMQGTGQADAEAFPAVNQLQFWVDKGLLADAPKLSINDRQIATNVERLPHWNIETDGSVEERMRAYLEVNCQHCHNNRGNSSNTGYYLDHFREVVAIYGVCKVSTAVGSGACNRNHIIVPGDAERSIVTCRLEANHEEPQKMMPPIARSVSHTEAVALLKNWINNVVDKNYANGNACN